MFSGFWVVVSVRQQYPGHSNHVADAVNRWNEYGFAGASPVVDMIDRLTRPVVKK